MISKKNLIINIAQNVVFWAISFFITLRLFMQTAEIRTIDLIYIFLFHIPFIVIVSLNSYHLVPNILKKRNIWLYLGIVFIAGFGLTYFLYELSFGVLSRFLFPNYYLVGLYSMSEILGIMTIYVSASTMIELSKSWFDKKDTDLKFAQLQEEKTNTELRALRAQINPHFLFNNLNTIYGEALKKTDKAPTMILKLSSILRYIVENMEKDFVALEAEVEYLKMYIDLQKERLSNPNRVIFNVHGNFEEVTLPPLLLINFVENCFKYGSTTEIDDRIHINLNYSDGTLIFSTSNNTSNGLTLERTSSGTGLSNAQKRLTLLYPEKHQLIFNETKEHFQLQLNIQLA